MADSRPSSPDDADDSDEPASEAPESEERTPDEADPADEAETQGEAETTPEPDDDPATPADASEELTEAELREQVEQKYDFENFGPAEMDEMSAEEWEAAFDADSWITGDELIDRVRRDLERQIAERHVFAVLEDVTVDGQRGLLAYSDSDYALVTADGSVEGFGTVLRDVKPTVALCSMESYEPADPPENAVLPTPDEVPEASNELGNLMLQIVAAVQALAGLGLILGGIFLDPAVAGGIIGTSLLVAAGLGFLVISFILFFTVANARLSDKFRAEEYRDRLRAVGLEDGERPDFLPTDRIDSLPSGSEEPAGS